MGAANTGQKVENTWETQGKNDRLEILENSSILTFCYKNNIFLQNYIA